MFYRATDLIGSLLDPKFVDVG